MTDLIALVNRLTAQRGPALTWYGTERVELTGPVVARWLAKITNLLGTDLCPDPFAPSIPGALHIALPASWQSALWAASAMMIGWTVTEASEEHDPSSVLVTDTVDEESAARARTGQWVLAHDLAALSFRWPDTLPSGVLDALGEVMAQPDSVATPADLHYVHVEELLPAPLPTAGIAEHRIGFISSHARDDARRLLGCWALQQGVVLVDSTHHRDEATRRIWDNESVSLFGSHLLSRDSES